MSNLNEMEGESDCEAGGECIIDEEHRTEDEEAVFRRVYDYLTEKKYLRSQNPARSQMSSKNQRQADETKGSEKIQTHLER